MRPWELTEYPQAPVLIQSLEHHLDRLLFEKNGFTRGRIYCADPSRRASCSVSSGRYGLAAAGVTMVAVWMRSMLGKFLSRYAFPSLVIEP